MHKSSLLRMEWFVENYLLDYTTKTEKAITVLDVGSYDVNGTYRHFFHKPKFMYTGLDMSAGRNVDYVPEKPYDWSEIKDASYDVIISGQCFEHIEFPWAVFAEMCRIVKENGYICIIVPRTQERHRFPVDTYRYDADGLAALAKYGNLIPEHISRNEAPITAPAAWFSHIGDCFMVARKPSNWPGMLDVKNYSFTPWPVDKLRTGFLTEENHPSFRRTITNLFGLLKRKDY